MSREYKKEWENCYFILRPEKEEACSEFSVQMLTENNIPGLLSFEKRSFNGEDMFYYDISGKQSFQSLYQSKKLDEHDLKKLLEGLLLTLQSMNSYFLPASGLLLSLDCIFLDDEGVSFCYDPVLREESDVRLLSFAEELLGMTDHEKEKAVVLVYAFYRLVKEGNRTEIAILRQLFDENTQAEGSRQGEAVCETDSGRADSGRADSCRPDSCRPDPGSADSEYFGWQEESYIWKQEDGGMEEEGETNFARKKTTRPDPIGVCSFLLLMILSIFVLCYPAWQDGGFTFSKIMQGSKWVLPAAFFLLGAAGLCTCLFLPGNRERQEEKQRERQEEKQRKRQKKKQEKKPRETGMSGKADTRKPEDVTLT